ncbi:NAD(P)-dependent dehydrogenase (short-subunit alcohol dehydrogenase family) [Staphylococcus hominis]|uniref:SDR family oxidoreductase n=1 Tax=Staphylococcus hominis TaxID=1290 RepID=UPI003F6633EC
MSNYLILGSQGQISSNFIKNFIDVSNDKLILVDRVSPIKTNEVPNSIINFTFDITKKENYNGILKFLIEHDMKIDKILFSVGKNPMNNFFSSNIDDFESTLSTNLTSLYVSLKVLYDFFDDKTSIVVISSQNGIVGHEDRIEYGPSKAALIHLVKNLSVDFSLYSKKDIKINCISPGYVKTSRNISFFNSIKGKKLLNKSLYKKLTTLDEISYMIDFLLKDHSDSIRGQNISMDYGYTII